jgi:hypothetical protein
MINQRPPSSMQEIWAEIFESCHLGGDSTREVRVGQKLRI